MVWVNGRHLGRYWEAEGPQHALFLPAPYLEQGANELLLLELDAPRGDATLSFSTAPDFSGKPAPSCKGGGAAAGDVLQMFDCDSSMSAAQGCAAVRTCAEMHRRCVVA